ncbi:MAG: hypothetical protein K0S61_1784 [Anaerocolumna sp.]|jgi:hypothetical protein|nr:hypothetical protein [Anaerocolumna sp.]
MTLLEASKKRQCIWDCMEENITLERTVLKVGLNRKIHAVNWFHRAFDINMY